MRRISIIHPSRGRASIALSVVKSWMLKADHPESIEYILCIDTDDNEPYWQLAIDFLDSDAINIILSKHPNKSAIEAINRGALTATGDILIVVSDDFDCPEHWDTMLLQALEGKEDFCVKTKDGIQPTLMTLPILDRNYYNRFGYIYHPDYLHMYSDQEMTAVAHMLGRNVDVDLLFPHNHYSTKKFVKDAISIKNDKTYPQGKQVFDRRLRTNFGIENPVKPYTSIKWH